MVGADDVVTHQQFAEMMGVLHEIRDLLVMSVVQREDESTECQHPEEQRISLGYENRIERWVCKVCRFDSGHPDGLSQN